MFNIPIEFTEKIKQFQEHIVHVIMIATKPDIIKQAPIYEELKNRWKQVILIHTGQHYDFNLSGWMLEEFNLEVDLNLGIEWSYHKKVAQVISNLGDCFEWMKTQGKTPIPYVHWDTMTSMAASSAAWCNMIWCVHVEAWIRSLWLNKHHYLSIINDKINFKEYRELHLNLDNYEWWRIEPYPEQYNTRCSEPASWIYLAPSAIAKKNLVKEWFRKDRIFVVWNSVADVTKQMLEKSNESKIFEKYPKLKSWFIRFCIHRRENCQDINRFTAIFEWMEKIVKIWKTVLLISLFATEKAINDFWFRQRLDKLSKCENFIYSQSWPYYLDVITAMSKCSVCATDSGSMQEEMNILWIPTVTLRYWTDRPESCQVWWNVIAPPYSWDLIKKIIVWALNTKEMKNVWNIYWKNVSAKSVSKVLKILDWWWSLFEFYKI